MATSDGGGASRRIAAAWELVEFARDYVVEITTWNDGRLESECVFERPDADWGDADALMPRAITRAFIMAMTANS